MHLCLACACTTKFADRSRSSRSSARDGDRTGQDGTAAVTTHTHTQTERKEIMLMKEYRICMPLTVEEVSK